MLWKPEGSARIAGEPNRQERDQRAGEERGQRKRHSDAARRGPGIAAEDRGGVFEVARDAVDRVRDKHEDVREGVAGNDEDDAGQGVNVEQILVLFGAGDGAERLVEKATVRCRQQLPGDRAEEGRRDERRGDQRAHRAAQRHVGAGNEPTHRRCDDAADRRRAHGQDQGRDQWIEEDRVGDEQGEIAEREAAGAVVDAVIGEPGQRQHDQHGERRRKGDEDRP
jgi:hypothetical protein